jgi:hypothetical protein
VIPFIDDGGLGMRGSFQDQGGSFSYISLEGCVPEGHPLRKVRDYIRVVLIDLHEEFSRKVGGQE